MRYPLYSTEDFIQDEHFQKWVRHPDPDSDKFWKDFLAEYPHKAESIEEAREFILQFREYDSEVSADRIKAIKSKMNHRIDAYEQETRVRRPRRSAKMRRIARGKAVLGMAAAIVIFFVAILFLLKPAIVEDGLLALTNMEKQSTARDEERLLVLADGTKVWLNAGSQLRFPREFQDRDSREVHLDGEAFFKVTSKDDQPFIVHTEEISIKVTGTSFNLRAYSTDNVTETTVIHGTLSLITKHASEVPPLYLTADQQALFDKNGGKLTLSTNVDTSRVVAWYKNIR